MHWVHCFPYVSTLWYVLRKLEDRERRQSLRAVCEIFSVASASQNEILEAIDNDRFADFENCLQDKCAKEVGADYIVTCNHSGAILKIPLYELA